MADPTLNSTQKLPRAEAGMAVAMATSADRPPSGRIRGLDTLRFLAAFVVVVSHIPLLPISVAHSGVRIGVFLEALQRSLFNGTAAVVVFFLISGFVIHHPYAQTTRVPLAEFWCRRWLRICLPLFAVTLLAMAFSLKDFPLFWQVGFRWIPLGPGQGYLFDTLILWSLVAELIYYLIYPGLHRVALRLGWAPLVGISFGLSWLVVSFQPQARVAGNFTNWLCWLAAMPPWVMGVWLADRHVNHPSAPPDPQRRGRLWGWRLALLAGSLATKALSSPPVGTWPVITYSWTMPCFGIIALFWLRAELAGFSVRPPVAWLEKLGLSSYSLYLVHIPAREIWARLVATEFAENHFILSNLALWLAALGFSYLFFQLIELPSWKFARRMANFYTVKAPVP